MRDREFGGDLGRTAVPRIARPSTPREAASSVPQRRDASSAIAARRRPAVAASEHAHAEIDSTNTASLSYTSSIVRRSPRFPTSPPTPIWDISCTVNNAALNMIHVTPMW